AITVPKGITAIGNGRLVSKRHHHGKTTWRWVEDSPMATYLATATNGVFDLLAAEAEVIRFFSRLYGPYPFSSGGGIVDHAPEVGYALESQTKSQYDQTPDAS